MVTKTEKEKGVSLRPKDAVDGGGLFQGTCIWRNPRFEEWTYPGREITVPAFAVDLEVDGDVVTTQYWSAGNLDDFKPSRDGEKLIPVGGRAITKSTNLYHLMESLGNTDPPWPEDKFPMDDEENDIHIPASVFEGMECIMVRVPAPERKGLQQKEKKYESQILLVDKIITFPWDAEGGTKKEEKDETGEKANEAILEILGDKGYMKAYAKGLPKMKLAQEVFKRLKTQKVDQTIINVIVQLIGGKDEAFMTAGPWKFEKGVVSLS